MVNFFLNFIIAFYFSKKNFYSFFIIVRFFKENFNILHSFFVFVIVNFFKEKYNILFLKFYYIFIKYYLPKIQVIINYCFFKIFIPYLNLEYYFQNNSFFISLAYACTVLILIVKVCLSFSFLINSGLTIYKKVPKHKRTKQALIIFTKSIDLKDFVTLNNFIKIYHLFMEISTFFFLFKTIIVLKNQLEIASTLVIFFNTNSSLIPRINGIKIK